MLEIEHVAALEPDMLPGLGQAPERIAIGSTEGYGIRLGNGVLTNRLDHQAARPAAGLIDVRSGQQIRISRVRFHANMVIAIGLVQ